MILPAWAYAAGAAALLAAGAWGGWTVRDWQRDSEVLAGLETATKEAKASATWMRSQGDAYEKDRQDDQTQSTVRESTINTIYRDHDVPADCAVPAAAGSVLDGAIAAANARAAGQSGGGLPAGEAAAVPVP